VTRWLADYLAAASPGIAIDIGANLGWHAVHAARQRNIETLVAFEPDPFNAWLLERNLARQWRRERRGRLPERSAPSPGLGRLHRYKSSNSAAIHSPPITASVRARSASPISTARW